MQTNRIDLLNIFLILLSLLAAFFAPLDLILFSYAFLGPAHYITEIVWLEKRNYFLSGKRDYLPLAITATFVILALFFSPATISKHLTSTLFCFCALTTLIMTYARDCLTRYLLIGMASILLAWSWGFRLTHLIYIFVPTLIHVYLFTGLFILMGALKSKSRMGMISLLVFILAGISCFVIEPYPLEIFRFYSASEGKYFAELAQETMGLFSRTPDTTSSLSMMAFISFAYTYHYLNWFSKTQIIRWHDVSRSRLITLIIIYALCILAYLIDYQLGYLLLIFLSLLHVVLELPLNFRTMEGLTRSILGKTKITK